MLGGGGGCSLIIKFTITQFFKLFWSKLWFLKRLKHVIWEEIKLNWKLILLSTFHFKFTHTRMGVAILQGNWIFTLFYIVLIYITHSFVLSGLLTNSCFLPTITLRGPWVCILCWFSSFCIIRWWPSGFLAFQQQAEKFHSKLWHHSSNFEQTINIKISE